jgi:hypothetical protein
MPPPFRTRVEVIKTDDDWPEWAYKAAGDALFAVSRSADGERFYGRNDQWRNPSHRRAYLNLVLDALAEGAE